MTADSLMPNVATIAAERAGGDPPPNEISRHVFYTTGIAINRGSGDGHDRELWQAAPPTQAQAAHPLSQRLTPPEIWV